MNVEPRIGPLNAKGDIYGIWDERGRLIGTGTAEVCEVLLYLITRSIANLSRVRPEVAPRQLNVKAAISI